MDKTVLSHNRSIHLLSLDLANTSGTGLRWHRRYPLHVLVQPQPDADESVKEGVGGDCDTGFAFGFEGLGGAQ